MAEIPPALTLWRPWPELILRFGKNVENRDWGTPYRGPVLIHAGKTWDHGALNFCRRIGSAAADEMSWEPADHPTGLVGVVDLTDVCQSWRKRCIELGCDPWGIPGSDHWQLKDPTSFATPVPCPGRQGLWYPSVELHEQIAQAVRHG